jgi:hypothetical protein
MEGKILNVLDWDLNGATACSFHARFCSAGQLDETTKLTAQYLMERYLQEFKSVAHLPSKIAAGAVSLALRINQSPSWVAALSKRPVFYCTTPACASSIRACLFRVAEPRPCQVHAIQRGVAPCDQGRAPRLRVARAQLELEGRAPEVLACEVR